MSYLVLARKWRPQTFEEIRGQGHIVRALCNAISLGRIAHAYVFTGIRGVGKTSAARVLAKALNCATGPTPTPCNTCQSCRDITEGKSPDVLEIDGASNTGVEDVRRLREAVRYPPVGGAYRIYIIDEVHMLSTAAFNALLKTLEEPPAHVVFVFATTDPRKIPVTILSRCQQFDFKRLAPRELMELLGEVARAENISIDERSLMALAREAEGSVRDAQSLLDQVISYAGQSVTYEDARDVLGVVDRDLLLSVARAVVKRDPRAVVEAIAQAERFGYDVRRFAYDLADVFRDLAILRALEDGDDLVDLAPEEIGQARQLLEETSWEHVHALFDMLSRGLDALRSTARPGSVLEMTLLKMTKLPPLLDLSEVLARVKGGTEGSGGEPPHEAPAGGRAARADRKGPSNAPPRSATERRSGGDPPAPLPVPEGERGVGSNGGARMPPTRLPGDGRPESAGATAPPNPGAPPPGSLEPAPEPASPVLSPNEVWRTLLDGAEEANRPFWSVLKEHGSLAAWDPGGRVAVVSYDDPSHEFFLRSKVDVLSGILQEHVGAGARVELRSAGGGGRPRNGLQETDRARSVKREALKHPLVRDAVEIFQGDVEDVRVLKP